MNKIIIFSDSTCDLSAEIIKKNNIEIVPLYINFNSKYYKDGVEITPFDLYQKVKELDILPKTSAASPKDFIEAFTPHIKNGDKIIYIGLSSELSSTIQNSIIAANEFPDDSIHIIDSRSLSTGIGLQVLKACKLRDEGLDIIEIVDKINNYIPKVKASFVIKTFDYLHKGGRCSAMATVLGTALNIKPIIKVIDGKMDVANKPIGFKKGLNILLRNLKNDIQSKGIELDCVLLNQSFSPLAADYVRNKLSKIVDPSIILDTTAGCVISSHCGEGTIGLMYITK